ncbi:MAG: hypothetical protein ACI4C5_08825 [Lachnospiraceae bacterium]
MQIKTKVMFIVAYFFVCIEFSFFEREVEQFSLFVVVGYYIALMFICLYAFNLIQGIGHLVSGIVYWLQGYGFSTVVVYPFVFFWIKSIQLVFLETFFIC